MWWPVCTSTVVVRRTYSCSYPVLITAARPVHEARQDVWVKGMLQRLLLQPSDLQRLYPSFICKLECSFCSFRRLTLKKRVFGVAFYHLCQSFEPPRRHADECVSWFDWLVTKSVCQMSSKAEAVIINAFKKYTILKIVIQSASAPGTVAWSWYETIKQKFGPDRPNMRECEGNPNRDAWPSMTTGRMWLVAHSLGIQLLLKFSFFH